jgi:hypothetical protein
MTTPNGYVSNEVIAIKLDALTVEVQQLRRELVRSDVYEAERRADALELANVRSEVATVRAELAAAGQRKWGVWLALIPGAFALALQLMNIGG